MNTIYIATAYWCHDDNWVIAAGADREAVVRDADSYMKAHPAGVYDEKGHFKFPDAKGRAAEGYIMEEVQESVRDPEPRQRQICVAHFTVVDAVLQGLHYEFVVRRASAIEAALSDIQVLQLLQGCAFLQNFVDGVPYTVSGMIEHATLAAPRPDRDGSHFRVILRPHYGLNIEPATDRLAKQSKVYTTLPALLTVGVMDLAFTKYR